MYIIVIGCGKVGSKFAVEMSQEGNDVVVIDNDPSSFNRIDDAEFSGLKLIGVPIDQDILKKAGIESADILCAMTPDDNMNIMVSQIAKVIYKVPKVLARIYDPNREEVFNEFGLDTICPTNISVEIIKSMILNNTSSTYHTLGNSTVSFEKIQVSKEYVGKLVGDISIEDERFLFGIERKGTFLFATPKVQINSGDILVLSRKID